MSVISLFSGAMGLDLGLEAAGFDVKAAVEVNKWAAATIERHRSEHGLTLFRDRVEDVTTDQLLEAAGAKRGEVALVSGGPSCQTFSTAGHRRSLGDDRGWLFKHFTRVVREAQPRFFVMENVRGILSAAVQHRPLAERGPGFPTLTAEEQHGSAFRLILEELRGLGYYVVFGLVDAADYGAAQHRQRLVFLGSRDGEDVRIPEPTHGPRTASPYRTLRDALKGLDDSDPVLRPLPPEWARFLKRVPEGGNWRDLSPKMQREALGAAYVSWGGRSGFFRRVAWDRPTPAVTTNPAAKATMLAHPSELRTLSVRELARLQGFSDDWTFAGGVHPQFSQVGNAVPLPLGEAVGNVFSSLMAGESTADTTRCGIVACADVKLVERFNARPRTVLNPQRMRGDATLASARKWMADLGGSRRLPIDVEILDAAA
jgi:DNA (cytosine-5)-methyltransferase 1